MGSVGAEFCLKGAEWRGLECGEEEGGIRRESSVLRVLEIELLGKSPRATMATMVSDFVGNQCRPDLLDAPITILSICTDSIAAATQNGVSKMSTVL